MLAAFAALASLAVLVTHGMLHCSVRRIITVIAMTATLALEHAGGCGACGDCGVCCACGACVPKGTCDASVPAALAILKVRWMLAVRALRLSRCGACGARGACNACDACGA